MLTPKRNSELLNHGVGWIFNSPEVAIEECQEQQTGGTWNLCLDWSMTPIVFAALPEDDLATRSPLKHRDATEYANAPQSRQSPVIVYAAQLPDSQEDCLCGSLSGGRSP